MELVRPRLWIIVNKIITLLSTLSSQYNFQICLHYFQNLIFTDIWSFLIITKLLWWVRDIKMILKVFSIQSLNLLKIYPTLYSFIFCSTLYQKILCALFYWNSLICFSLEAWYPRNPINLTENQLQEHTNVGKLFCNLSVQNCTLFW